MAKSNNPFDILVEQRSDFIVLGLTGRTGSGCTTTTTLLDRKVNKFPSIQDLQHVEGYELSSLSQKRYDIAKHYAQKHFPSFLPIKISDLISAMVIAASHSDLVSFVSGVLDEDENKVKKTLKAVNFENRAKRIARWQRYLIIGSMEV